MFNFPNCATAPINQNYSQSQCQELLNDPVKSVCFPIYNNTVKYAPKMCLIKLGWKYGKIPLEGICEYTLTEELCLSLILESL